MNAVNPARDEPSGKIIALSLVPDNGPQGLFTISAKKDQPNSKSA
jgi:hypothetical protein